MSRICIPFLRCHFNTILIQNARPIIKRYLYISRTKLAQKNESSIKPYKESDQISTDVRPLGEKVKETAKTTSYLGVILIGLGVTGAMFYTIFSELFSSTSPNTIYSNALDRCVNDSRVEALLGAPIKGFGEETRRGRRRHVSHATFMKDGVKHLRMKFYIKGSFNRGTVHLEMVENSAGSYDYLYLIVQLDDYSQRTVILENNMVKKAGIPATTDLLDDSW